MTSSESQFVGQPFTFIVAYIFVSVFALFRFQELISLYSNPLIFVFMITLIFVMATLILRPPKSLLYALKRLLLLALICHHFKAEMDEKINKVTDNMMVNLEGNTCIISGMKGEVEWTTASLLSKLGASVYVGCSKPYDICRSELQRAEALKIDFNETWPGSIDIIPLDTSDLNSVFKFIELFKQNHSHLDYLILGEAVPSSSFAAGGMSTTAQGLEFDFGASHVGNAALIEGLLGLMTTHRITGMTGGGSRSSSNGNVNRNINCVVSDQQNGEDTCANSDFEDETRPPLSSRIVFLAGPAYIMGSFDSSLLLNSSGAGDLSGEKTRHGDTWGPLGVRLLSCSPFMRCPLTNSYARAQLANILFATELQERLDMKVFGDASGTVSSSSEWRAAVENNESTERVKKCRTVVSVVSPGSFSPFYVPPFLHRIISLLFLRTPTVASRTVLYALRSDIYTPGAYIDPLLRSHDLAATDLRSVHVSAWPDTKLLKFARITTKLIFSFDEWMFPKLKLCWDCATQTSAKGMVSAGIQRIMSRRLWDVTQQIIADARVGRSILQSNVTISSE